MGELIGLADARTGLFSLNEGRARRLVLRGSEVRAGLIDGWFPPDANRQDEIPDQSTLANATKNYPFIYNMIDFVDSEISDELYADEMLSEGPIAASHARIGNLRLREATLNAADFRNVRIARDVDFRGARISAPGASNGCIIDNVYKQDANFVALSQSKIGGSILFRNNRSPGSGSANGKRAQVNGQLCLNDVEVGNNVDVSSLDANGIVLSGSDIGGAVLLADVNDHAVVRNALDLSLLTARRLQLSTDLTLPVETSLAGAAIGQIALVDLEKDADPALSLKNMLSNLTSSVDTLASYRAVAASLRNMEDTDAASQLEIAREHRLTESAASLHWLWRIIQWVVGGYGYAPLNTFFVAIFTTMIGALVAYLSDDARKFLDSLQRPAAPAKARGGEFIDVRNLWLAFDAFVFSLDRLIPLVSINGKNKEVLFRKQRWVRAYFVGHSLLGYLLSATALQFVAEAIGVGAG
ncbi:MAG: hypothetical protein OXH79_01995 [Boseongicola sp.]|nr:hypothetical protein [Boseongicola sp.]